MDNQRGKADRDLNWLAGIWEGEGCFQLGRNASLRRYGPQLFPRVLVTNTDESMIRELQRILVENDCSGGWVQTRVRRAPYRVVYHLTLHGWKRVARFLDLVLPYLRTDFKRTDAILLREAVQQRLEAAHKEPYSPRLWQIWGELRTRHGHGILRDFTPGPEHREDKVQSGSKTPE